MKNCSNKKCIKDNPQLITQFSKNKTSKDGFQQRCKSCNSLDKAEYVKSNPEKNRARGKKFRVKNKEKIKKYNKKWEQDNTEWRKNYTLEWNKNNPDKLKKKDTKWRLANPEKRAAKQMKRQANKLKATPKWLTDEQNKEILEFYILAKELQWLSEEQLQVDHIVPLQGKAVCGLHVPWNLQILPRSMNIGKGNKIK